MSGARKRVLGLAPAAITAAVTWWFLATGSWRILGIWPEPALYAPGAEPHTASFADLAYLTAVADCMSSGIDFTTCDPYGRPFQPYGVVPGSMLSVFGLGLSDTGWLGVALAVIWVVLIGVLGVTITAQWNRSTGALLAGLTALTLIAISPPALLGIERGQFEVLIIALTALGLAWIVRPTRAVTSTLGALALTFSVVLKYLSIGAFAAFAAPGRWRWWGIAAGAASVVFLMLNLDDLALARETARADQASTTRVMFSSTTAFVTLLVEDPLAFAAPSGQVMNNNLLRVLGALLFIVLMLIWWIASRRSSLATSVAALPDLTWNLVIGGGFALIVPFFLGASNDYRLMFLVIPLTGLLLWIGAHNTSSHALWVVVVLMVFAALPAGSMIPNDSGFIVPEAIVVAGDLALTGALAAVAVIYLRGWGRSAQIAHADR